MVPSAWEVPPVNVALSGDSLQMVGTFIIFVLGQGRASEVGIGSRAVDGPAGSDLDSQERVLHRQRKAATFGLLPGPLTLGSSRQDPTEHW